MLLQNKLISAAGIILLASLAMPAGAGTLYKWTTEDGSVAFSDDLKRIPERYRDRVATIQTGGLDNYERFTPADSAAQGEQRRLLEERLERLRAQNQPPVMVAVPAPGAGGPVSETIVQVNDSTALRIPATASDEEPIVVEEVRVLRKGSNITIHDTVVRQGDKVLVVVRPAQWMQGGPDYIDEEDLFE
jgi:hypothetical protein